MTMLIVYLDPTNKRSKERSRLISISARKLRILNNGKNVSNKILYSGKKKLCPVHPQ